MEGCHLFLNLYLRLNSMASQRKHPFSHWLVAVRPWSFPASAMPVAVTLAYLYWAGHDMNWANGLWALANIIVFHAAGNTWSDYYDYKRGVDAQDTFGVHTLTGGMFAPPEIRRLSLVLLAVALLGGVGLLLRTGLPLLYVGVGGLLCTVLYPALKYRAWGDAVIFVAYALLPTVGTSYAALLKVDWTVLLLAVPVGLITVAILHANNTRDMQTDRRVHITTFAMKLGGRVSMGLYCVEVGVPYVWVLGCVLLGLFPWWALLCWLSAVAAVGNMRVALGYGKDGATGIARLDELTAKLQLMFSLLLVVSFALAGWMQ